MILSVDGSWVYKKQVSQDLTPSNRHRKKSTWKWPVPSSNYPLKPKNHCLWTSFFTLTSANLGGYSHMASLGIHLVDEDHSQADCKINGNPFIMGRVSHRYFHINSWLLPDGIGHWTWWKYSEWILDTWFGCDDLWLQQVLTAAMGVLPGWNENEVES